MIRVRYATTMRPPQPGAFPRKGVVEVKCIDGVAPSGHHAWGWVDYDRYLMEAEIKDYELEYVSSYECTDEA